MKTKNLLLALCCTAALTACTNNDEPAVAPAMRTVTLSVEVAEPADTRVAYTEDGTTYKFAWAASDKLRVFYNEDGTEKSTSFTIGTISGKKAEFTGDLPASVTNVTICYSSTGFVGSGDKAIVTGIYQGNILTALKNKTYLYATDVAVADGKLTDVKLQHAAAYLLLKEGLQVVDKNVTAEYSYGIPEYTEQFYNLKFSSTGIEKTYTSGVSKLPAGCISEGALTKDVLVAFYVPAEGESLALPFYIYDSSDAVIGSAIQPSHTYKPGVIYEVKAGHSDWVAAKLSEE